jgi:CHAT domain-containing protein
VRAQGREQRRARESPDIVLAEDGAREALGERVDSGLVYLSSLQPDTLVAHFSCHGGYDNVRPLSSGLELRDRLTLQAVLDHPHAAWLVNLSACETGVPDLTRSEQMISLPVGFLLGGAAHVIATLWSVGNDQATEYNRRFYQRLLAGERPALAHRGTINELRAASTSKPTKARTLVVVDQSPLPMLDHPFWWAGFTHYGSPW